MLDSGMGKVLVEDCRATPEEDVQRLREGFVYGPPAPAEWQDVGELLSRNVQRVRRQEVESVGDSG